MMIRIENLIEDMGRIAEDLIGMAGDFEAIGMEKEGDELREIVGELFEIRYQVARKQKK